MEEVQFTVYNERLLDHFQNPRHAGFLEDATHVVDLENPICGDRLKLSVRIRGERVEEAAFLVKGCTASIACGSAVAEWLQGRTTAELKSTDVGAVVEEAVGGLPNESKHAARLAAEAVSRLARQL